MTARTPIERGAEGVRMSRVFQAAAAFGIPAEHDAHRQASRGFARAVLEAALSDREGLAKAHYDAYRAANPGSLRWETEPAGIKKRFYDRADISIAYLTGGES